MRDVLRAGEPGRLGEPQSVIASTATPYSKPEQADSTSASSSPASRQSVETSVGGHGRKPGEIAVSRPVFPSRVQPQAESENPSTEAHDTEELFGGKDEDSWEERPDTCPDCGDLLDDTGRIPVCYRCRAEDRAEQVTMNGELQGED